MQNLSFHQYCRLELSVISAAITFAVRHMEIQLGVLNALKMLFWKEEGKKVIHSKTMNC